MASSAKTVAMVFDPGQSFVNLSHFASVPGSYMIKKSYSPLVGRVVKPLGVSFDLTSLSRKMSKSRLLISIKSTIINQVVIVSGLARGGDRRLTVKACTNADD